LRRNILRAEARATDRSCHKRCWRARRRYKPGVDSIDNRDRLSPQQRRILALVVEGRTNKEIAKGRSE
jgi:DNA-binding NarL/FixJ family response regulator